MKRIELTSKGKIVNITRTCATPAERDLMFRIKKGLRDYSKLTPGEKRVFSRLAKMGLAKTGEE